MPYKINDTAPATSEIDDALQDATTHRRQWVELFDDKILASEDDDVSYWEHEKRAFLRLLNQAAALQGQDLSSTMPQDSRAHPAMTVFLTYGTKFKHDYDAEELMQFLEDNGVHPAMLDTDHTMSGRTVTVESSALHVQAHVDLFGAFEKMKKAEAQPVKAKESSSASTPAM